MKQSNVLHVVWLICMMLITVNVSSITASAHTETEVPKELVTSAEYYGGMYGIEPNLILAICFAESSYRCKAENGSCVGLMQFNTATHQDIMETKAVYDIFDQNQNLSCGCHVLYELMEENNDINVVLMKYNGDKTGLKKYYQDGTVSEYALKVLELKALLDDHKTVY